MSADGPTILDHCQFGGVQAICRPKSLNLHPPYVHATIGGIELRIVSIFPAAFSPNIVPRS